MPVRPRALPPGGTIGVAAPASPFEQRSEIERGVRWWESHGYRVRLAEGIDARDDYVAGDARARARDLVELFEDPSVDAVQVLRGGYGCSEVVPHLDLDAIGRNPKPLVGFSDVTVLHTAVRQAIGLVTFYGPGLSGVGAADRGEFTLDRLLRALTDPAPLGPVPPDPDDPFVGGIGTGRSTGPLVGGCLWLLRETLATPWEIELDGSLLFFEDVRLSAWHLDGILTQLGHAGKLDRVAGVVVGQMHECEEWRFQDRWLRSRSIEDVLERHLQPLGVPVVHGLPLGHGKHLCTIPLGVTATVDADARTLTIDEPALASG